MAEFAGIYLWALGFGLFAYMLYQYLNCKHELLSFRNIYLIGFILNQCHSPADALVNGHWWMFKVYKPGPVGIECCLMTTFHLIIFIWIYEWGIGARALPAKIKFPTFDPTPKDLLFFASVLTAVAFAGRVGFYTLPHVLAILSYRTAVGLACVSCAMVAWAIGRKWNPAFLMYGGALILTNLVIANSDFSRRPLVAIFIAVPWGFYFAYWRYQRPSRVMGKLIAVSFVPILVVASFSSVRESGTVDRSISRTVNRMLTHGDPIKGVFMLASGDSTGPNTLWCIENFPEQFKPRQLFSLRFFFYLNIPRYFWPDKPVTIGNMIPTMIRQDGVNLKIHSLPPGIIGFAACEGGWYALAVYAWAVAVFLRIFDQFIKLNILNPFVVTSMACDLGQVLALARGDVALFANTVMTAVITTGGIVIFLAWLIAKRGVPSPPTVKGAWQRPDLTPPKRQMVTVWVPAEWAMQQRRAGRI